MDIKQQPQLPEVFRPIVCIGGGGIIFDAQRISLPMVSSVRGPGRGWTPLAAKDTP